MDTKDLIKILSIIYLGLLICLFGSFQSTKITENFLINQIIKEDNKNKSSDSGDSKEEDGILTKITDSFIFKVIQEIVNFVIKVLEVISIFIRTFF